jgi:hypothetical protein
MAYPIKNTAVSQINSVKTGGFYIGVNQGGYGLTSATAFWNGKTPNISRYIVYVGNGTSSPTMYIVLSDNNLITLSNTLGGGSNTTVQLALNYFINSANSVCVNIDIPNIFWAANLLLYIDAGYTPSYPRGFGTWYDISSVNNHIELVNGPGFSLTNYGVISFDGINDFGVSSSASFNLTRRVTVNVWVKHYAGGTSDYGNYVAKGANNGYRMRRNGPNGSPLWLYTDGNTIQGGAIFDDIWYMVTGVFDSTGLRAYIDGDLVASNTTPFNPTNVSSTELFVGAIFSGAEHIKADMFSVAIYSTALTQTQIKQNYYAGLQKLIPAGDDLVICLDGENTNTRVITPTTAYDISTNDYNGTFTNGTVLAHRDGGTVFSFDGIDDKIQTSLNGLNASTTWTAWVKRTTSVNFYNMFMGMYLPYFAFRSDGVLMFSNNIGGVQQSLTPSAGLVNNVWYHFTFISSYSGGNTTMSIYLNGVLLNQSTFAGQQPTTTNNSFRLGGWEDGGSYPFNGKIGDVRIYKRALTQTEITTIYKEGILRYGL